MPFWATVRRAFIFQLVGGLGVFVNLGVLWILKGKLGVPVVPAGACAIELAIIHNFTWHYFFTWRDRVAHSLPDYLSRLLKYNVLTASIDFTVNLGLLWALTTYAHIHYLVADLIGMTAGPALKFAANELFIFKRRSVKGGEGG